MLEIQDRSLLKLWVVAIALGSYPAVGIWAMTVVIGEIPSDVSRVAA